MPGSMPHIEKREQSISYPGSLAQARRSGLHCSLAHEDNGGLGVEYTYSSVQEKVAHHLFSQATASVHAAIAAPYIFRQGSEEIKRPRPARLRSGETILALGMTSRRGPYPWPPCAQRGQDGGD